jgi:putative endonuclease
MKKELHPCIYIMSNKHNGVLYTGVTSNLFKRVSEHKNKLVDGFTNRYNVTKLVYYEEYETMPEAIAREKQIKGGSRQKKLDLINSRNPEWNDLYEEFFA